MKVNLITKIIKFLQFAIMVLMSSPCAFLSVYFSSLTDDDMAPANLMYEEGPCLPFDAGQNVELVILTVINAHTIMVLPKVLSESN